MEWEIWLDRATWTSAARSRAGRVGALLSGEREKAPSCGGVEWTDSQAGGQTVEWTDRDRLRLGQCEPSYLADRLLQLAPLLLGEQ